MLTPSFDDYVDTQTIAVPQVVQKGMTISRLSMQMPDAMRPGILTVDLQEVDGETGRYTGQYLTAVFEDRPQGNNPIERIIGSLMIQVVLSAQIQALPIAALIGIAGQDVKAGGKALLNMWREADADNALNRTSALCQTLFEALQESPQGLGFLAALGWTPPPPMGGGS